MEEGKESNHLLFQTFAFKGTFPKNIVNTQSMRLITDNRRHFLEIQLNREIHKFYPMLISIWTQRDICSKCLWHLPHLSQTLPLGQCSIYSPDSTRRGPPSQANLSLVIVTHLITLCSFKKTGLAQVICMYNLHESI